MKFWPFSTKAKKIDQIANQIDSAGHSRFGNIVINERIALRASTALACVDAISSGCSVPDLHVMRDLGDGKKERATDDPRHRLFYRRPNEFQTAMEFREALTMHAALTGNGYALITRDFRGRVQELLPLEPHNVVINRSGRYDETYLISDEFGDIGSFEPKDVFHLRNRSWKRIEGMDGLWLAQKAVGLSIATEQNIGDLQMKGGKPGGILTTEQSLSDEAVARVKAAWKAATTGSNAYGTALLDKGLGYQAMGMSAVDQQSVETRRFQVEEVCRIFGVFPQIVMHTHGTATFASAEAFFSAHSRLTVHKWQKNWVEKGDEFVLDGGGPLFLEFDNRELHAASLKDTGAFYAKSLGAGGAPAWMTPNEVRADQGLPPVEGGDVLYPPSAIQKSDERSDLEGNQDD